MNSRRIVDQLKAALCYNATGLEGLTDRSRRSYRHANQLPVQIETLIVRVKQDKPSWGAPKIRERLARLYPDVHTRSA
jgi:putative transposase